MTSPQIFDSIDTLVDSIPSGQRLLGLDIGEKTVGVAISDPSFIVASPLKTIQRGRKLGPVIDELRHLIAAENVGGLVAGLPVGMDGIEGPKCQSVRDTMREVMRSLELPGGFWDERLSTAAVERFLVAEADMTRRRRKEVVDKMAAGYILQGALDSLSR